MRRLVLLPFLLGGVSLLSGTSASGFIELMTPAATCSPAEDHLNFATVDRLVIVKARIDSICRPQELWWTEGTYDGTPWTHWRLHSPMRIAPIEYWRGEGPTTPYLVYLDGGRDPISGKSTFMEPFAPRWLKPGRVVVLFLLATFADSIRDPFPLPPSNVEEKHRRSLAEHGSPPKPRPHVGPAVQWEKPVPIPLEDRTEGIPFVAAGDGYWLDDEYAYADPVGRDSPLERGRMPLEEFRSIIGRMVANVAIDSLSAQGCWTEVTVLATSTVTTREGPRVFGWQVPEAQWVRAQVLWPDSVSGDTVTFFNPTKLATGWEGMAKRDPWAEHLRPVHVGDHRFVCLQERAGEKWAVGGENGVLRIADAGVRLWSVAADGRLVNRPVPLPEMRLRLTRGGPQP